MAVNHRIVMQLIKLIFLIVDSPAFVTLHPILKSIQSNVELYILYIHNITPPPHHSEITILKHNKKNCN